LIRIIFERIVSFRFYFVSAADLLDILSNGNEPEKVMRHLTKLFDSMAKLKLTEEHGATIKEATAMWAKDGEYMAFPSPCDLNGQVEIWLNRYSYEMKLKRKQILFNFLDFLKNNVKQFDFI
jgi:dynein heavy chain